MEEADKLEDDETTPIGKLLMKGKEVTKEPVSWKEHKDTTTRMEIEWMEIDNQKIIYELVAPWVGSPIVAEQVGMKPCSQSDTIHMMLEMEYLYSLMPNLEAYYFLCRLPMSFKLGIAAWCTHHQETFIGNVEN